MTRQSLFSGKSKRNISKCLLKFLPSMFSVNWDMQVGECGKGCYCIYLLFLYQTICWSTQWNRLTSKMPRKPASENVCLCRLLNILAHFSNLFLHTGKQKRASKMDLYVTAGPEVIKLFSCSFQLSMKFSNLLAEKFSCSAMLSQEEFAVNSNFKFISRTNFILSWAEHEKSFITSGPGMVSWGLNI